MQSSQESQECFVVFTTKIMASFFFIVIVYIHSIPLKVFGFPFKAPS